MKNQITKLLLPLAALTLVTVACDPFPAKPGGNPVILRVTLYDPATGHSNNIEPIAASGNTLIDNAQPGDAIRIHFSKPMDGSTIQKYNNYATNIPIDPGSDGILTTAANNTVVPPIVAFTDPGISYDPCFPADNLTLTGFETTPGVPIAFVPASGNVVADTGVYPINTLVCYDPSSVEGGGQLVVYPGAPLKLGRTYTISGTVKDYEGKPVSINVVITADRRPLPFARSSDGYSASLDWLDSGAAGYQVLGSTTGLAASYTLLWEIDPANDCDGIICSPYATALGGALYQTELTPLTDYWYQVKETTAPTGGTVTVTRPEVAGPITTVNSLRPTLGVATNTATSPVTVFPGIIRLSWSAVKGINGYDIEQSTDVGTTWTLAVHQVATQASTTFYFAGTAGDGKTTPTAAGTLTSRTSYSFRVTPTYASAFAAAKGRAATKVAP